MPDQQYTCKRCGVLLQGNSELCVKCYAWLHHPCPRCMACGADGRWRPIRKGRPPRPIECVVCNNERYVLYEYKPLQDKKGTALPRPPG